MHISRFSLRLATSMRERATVCVGSLPSDNVSKEKKTPVNILAVQIQHTFHHSEAYSVGRIVEAELSSTLSGFRVRFFLERFMIKLIYSNFTETAPLTKFRYLSRKKVIYTERLPTQTWIRLHLIVDRIWNVYIGKGRIHTGNISKPIYGSVRHRVDRTVATKYMDACMYVLLYLRMCGWMYSCLNACVYTCMYPNISIFTRMHTVLYVRIRVFVGWLSKYLSSPLKRNTTRVNIST